MQNDLTNNQPGGNLGVVYLPASHLPSTSQPKHLQSVLCLKVKVDIMGANTRITNLYKVQILNFKYICMYCIEARF